MTFVKLKTVDSEEFLVNIDMIQIVDLEDNQILVQGYDEEFIELYKGEAERLEKLLVQRLRMIE